MSKKEKRIYKCQPKKNIFCQVTLLERPDGHYGKGRGIFVANTINVKTRTSAKRLCYQWGSKMREFQYLPFCPACGTDLYPKESK